MATLKQGSRGSDVTKLQNTLKGLGYDVGSIDGIFGPKTLSAVKAYQSAQGLSVDGIVGPKTMGALSGGTSSTTTKPVASSSTKLQAPKVPKIEAFKPDKSNEPTAPVIEQFVPDESSKPEIPTIAPPPTIDPFDPQISREQLQQQALDLLLPQYQRGQEQLSDLYSQNIQHISDDALKRGLARGSYVGARQDRETTEHGKRLGDLERDYSEQANLMAAQDYEREWGKQYQLHRDSAEDIWRRYGAETDDLWRQYQAGMDLYRTDLDTQRFTYTANTENAWREYGALMDLYKLDMDTQRYQHESDADRLWQEYGADYSQYRDAIGDTQRQEEFDWRKKMDEEQLSLSKQQLELQKQAAARAGRSGSGGSSAGQPANPLAIAYDDVMGSSNPLSRFNQIKNQLKLAGVSQEDILWLEIEAKKKSNTQSKSDIKKTAQAAAKWPSGAGFGSFRMLDR